MKKHFLIAMFTVAVFALPTGVWGQTVYRCGSSYSQTPCEGGVMMEITPEPPQVAKENAARKAATLRALKREQMLEEDTIAHTEHYLYRRDAARAVAAQARAEAEARRAAAAREMVRRNQASKRAAKP